MNKTNYLINEKSPYLRQHALNPVEWYPWGEAAFQKAEEEDKPVFLSIGYSTCHWCHVMAHESFENESIARLLNDEFVCIKVDREERPDIDNVYMKVCQMMTGSGGWPLTIIMTPDKKPFFAGTYLPPVSRGGRTGMTDLIKIVKNAWVNERKKINISTEKIIAHLNQNTEAIPSTTDIDNVVDQAVSFFAGRFDKNNGGFGRAPKFPSPHNLIFLLRHGFFHNNNETIGMAIETLKRMRMGGIYDQIGHGFHRYSTDSEWKLPHFEKMLYDQAMLIYAYTEALQNMNEKDPMKTLFANTIDEVINYVEREMTDKNGAFYSAEDADSEGKEGKFYLWTESELQNVLDPDEFKFLKTHFSLSDQGNFYEEASREKTGENNLYFSDDAFESILVNENTYSKWEEIRQKLFAVREPRIHPGKDDKILTDWNGLMIAALAYTGRLTNKQRYVSKAEKAMSFILSEMHPESGLLLHRYKDGEKSIIGFLDDYAFVIWGLLELYGATHKLLYLEKAIELTDMLETGFWDKENSGYFFSGDQSETLITKTKEYYDGAIPSGNSVMLNNLFRLYHLTDNKTYNEHLNSILASHASELNHHPGAYIFSILPILQQAYPDKELVIVAKDVLSHQTRKQINSIY